MPSTLDAQAPIRVMVVDDHEFFRSGLSRLLDRDADLHVVGQAARGDEAIERAVELRPDVIVMDLKLPGLSGTEATREVRKVLPHVAVLMLTVTEDEHEVLAAVMAGAAGYLLKEATLPEIAAAVRGAARGQSPIAPQVLPGLLAHLRQGEPREVEPVVEYDLSRREHEVLELLVEGHDNLVIGRRLHLSASTVKHHVSSILAKLGVENRIQAAVLATRSGMGR